ncbi:hypothetical protein LTR09_001533 [Extremus antarcticus]|uniref:NTF2-like domain-containing protein n=1 Tax=Extremus antarcticus TaxID=702011 RepID=A0AAJ0GH35_9PEZI|nr:hypothetical protein LTR09_001533 [Extremus antarcticus]
MKFFATASVLVAIASTALAKTQGCLSTKQASQLVSRFSSLLSQSDSDLGDYNTTGKAILAKEYIEVSDSILSLTQRPLGSTTFSGRDAYLAGLGHAPPVTGIQTLGIYVTGCSKIVWQWQFNGVGSAEFPVKGFSLFTTNRKNQLTMTELEFNSVAWGQDISQLPCGDSEPTSSGPPSAGGSAPPEPSSAAPASGPPAST